MVITIDVTNTRIQGIIPFLNNEIQCHAICSIIVILQNGFYATRHYSLFVNKNCALSFNTHTIVMTRNTQRSMGISVA